MSDPIEDGANSPDKTEMKDLKMSKSSYTESDRAAALYTYEATPQFYANLIPEAQL